jgi:hypothetical protein
MEISEEPTSEEPTAEARAQEIKDHIFRYTTGTLTYKEFRKLPKMVRKMYTRRHGAPDSPEEAAGRRQRIAKERARKRAARKSRKMTRR